MSDLRASIATRRAFAEIAELQQGDPAILTCAVSGGIVTGNPHQPADRDDVVREALGAAAAGASVVHIHARSTSGELSHTSEDYLAIKTAIRAENEDVVLNFTTGGDVDAAPEDHRRSLAAAPDLATVNCGSINIGGLVLVNPDALVGKLAAAVAEAGVVPEYECFDTGMAVTAARLASSVQGAPGMMHMTLGMRGAAPASAEMISAFARLVPTGVPWAATAVGARNFPLMAVTLALGGHVRTGLEDVVYVEPGVHAESNAQLVTRARALCELLGRPVATPSQARELLGCR